MKCLQQIANTKHITFPVVVLTLCSLKNIIFYQLVMFKETVTHFSCGSEALLVNICRKISPSLYTFPSLGEVTQIIIGLWKFSLRVGVMFGCWLLILPIYQWSYCSFFPGFLGERR